MAGVSRARGERSGRKRGNGHRVRKGDGSLRTHAVCGAIACALHEYAVRRRSHRTLHEYAATFERVCGVVCTLAVTGAGGPPAKKQSDVIQQWQDLGC
eukprot:4626733-Pyramimonas_sp.AAC.1